MAIAEATCPVYSWAVTIECSEFSDVIRLLGDAIGIHRMNEGHEFDGDAVTLRGVRNRSSTDGRINSKHS